VQVRRAVLKPPGAKGTRLVALETLAAYEFHREAEAVEACGVCMCGGGGGSAGGRQGAAGAAAPNGGGGSHRRPGGDQVAVSPCPV
jgi:hypothetical protein